MYDTYTVSLSFKFIYEIVLLSDMHQLQWASNFLRIIFPAYHEIHATPIDNAADKVNITAPEWR